MLWLRRKWFWTDPLPPVSQYVNVLGSKLKMLLRAPSGVSGNAVLADSWSDEISLINTSVAVKLPRTIGTPTLAPVASLFGGKAVVQIPATGRFSGSFNNPLIDAGDSPEVFCVFSANALVTNNRVIIAHVDGGGGFGFALLTGVSQLKISVNGGNSQAIAFTDTTAVHFFSGRRDPSTGNVIANLDGVDTIGGAVGVVNAPCRRLDVSGATAFDGNLALCGLVQSPMTTAERADVLRIARQEYAF